MKTIKFAICLLIALLPYGITFAQFSVDGQILQRTEYRHGFSRLISEGQDPAMFIAHRARLQALYEMNNFTFYMSVQDVRTWGNTPQVKLSDNFLSVHEAWAATKLGEYWTVKLGRQELNYDNFRFLGNLDWALQGRAHDFALVKYEKNDMKLHFGGAYNQDGQALSGNAFTVPNQYKAAQMVRYENKFDKVNLTLLFWNDGRQFIQRNNNGEITDKRLFYRQTIGVPMLKYTKGNSTVTGFYYHQLGKDPIGKEVNAYNLSLAFNQKMAVDAEKGSGLTLSLGFEFLSGTAANELEQNNSYNPLYGTNHLFNGYMDLFFVGGTHEDNVGLRDYFIRGRYAFNKKLFIQADVHAFYSFSDVLRIEEQQTVEEFDKFFGTQLDFSLGYILNDAVSIQGGYSQMFHTDSFEFIQPNNNLQSRQNWAYLMLIFRPTMKNKFIGILL